MDAWGIMDNERTIIEIKSTSAEGFYKIQRALELKEIGNNAKVQDLFHNIAPHYYYQLQAQMFCTGLQKAVIHIVNRNRYETLTVLISRDEKAIEWACSIVNNFFESKKYYELIDLDLLKIDFLRNSLGFNLAFPNPKKLEELKQFQINIVLSLIKENKKIEETLREWIEVDKKTKSINAKLTSLGFRDEQRKIYKKSLARVAV